MKPFCLFTLLLCIRSSAIAQVDDYIHYNYKTKHEVLLDSVIHHFEKKEYEEAAKYLGQINLEENTNTEEFYINGIAIYKHLSLQAEDDSLKILYAQKMLELYDIRILRFDNKTAITNRKLFDYFALMHDVPTAHDQVFGKYHAYFHENTAAIENYNIIPYAYLARHMEQRNEITEDEFSSIIDELNTTVEAQPERFDNEKLKAQLEKLTY